MPLLRQALIPHPESAEAKLALAECLAGSGKAAEARPYAEAAATGRHAKTMPRRTQRLADVDRKVASTESSRT